MNSPFEFGSTVSNKTFTNRVLERKRISVNLTSGINTVLISPRRWGKSSLVEMVAKDILESHKNFRIVFVDLFSVNTEEEFLELFARNVIKASETKAEGWLKTAKDSFKKLVPKMVFNTDLGDLTLEFNKEDIKKNKDEILNLPETIALHKKVKFIICIDEFQNIVNYDKELSLEKAMRSYWQRHKNAVYCLYGSKRHMISDIFNNSSRPFYKFGDIIFLTKIERQEWIKFIIERFADTKKSIDEKLADKIAAYTQDHSWYVQQLSHITWLLTDKKVTNEIVEVAFSQLKYSQTPLFQNSIENMSNTQINLLKAVYKNEKHLTADATMKTYNLGTPNNVRKNIAALIHSDIIDKTGDEYIFMDPVYGRLFGELVMKE